MGLEAEYELPVRMFKGIVDVNEVFVKTDETEVLDGDNHMSNTNLHPIAEAVLKAQQK